nr:hypothetical protein [Pedobacter kyonggii]
MTAPNQQNKLIAFLPYLLSVITYFGGSYINSLNYTDKVDNLITTVNNMNQKMDSKTEKDNAIDKRVSKIEFYLFEYKKPVEQTVTVTQQN